MHKGFDAWLKSNYEGGQPTAVDLQTAQDDEDSIVALSSTIYNLNDGDANLSPAPASQLVGLAINTDDQDLHIYVYTRACFDNQFVHEIQI